MAKINKNFSQNPPAADVKELRLQRLKQLFDLFKANNSNALRPLLGDISAEALRNEDKALLDVGLLAYSFSKFLEKPYIVESPEWKQFVSEMLADLKQAEDYFKKNKVEAGTALLDSVVQHTENLSASLGRFIHSAVEKARIKAATQIYAHGASLGKAAEFTGASK
ncbi:hypothetical protein H0N96_01295, partial [Candidatus Micrarchaeota archaeon]|nr:hypothetical protein [Candidatus Micrarchaeota archaeon]